MIYEECRDDAFQAQTAGTVMGENLDTEDVRHPLLYKPKPMAILVFDKMWKQGVSPNAVTYLILIVHFGNWVGWTMQWTSLIR